MTDTREGLGDYIRTVRETTQEYLRDLTQENEKLCALIRTLEGQLDQERRERLQVEERIKAVEAERRSYLERYLDVETQNDNVSKLYAATLRLHGTISHADVLAAIHEIVINLVGSEELAVFEMSEDRARLVVSSSHGMDASTLLPIPVGAGIIGHCAVTGLSYVTRETAGTPARPVLPARDESHGVRSLRRRAVGHRRRRDLPPPAPQAEPRPRRFRAVQAARLARGDGALLHVGHRDERATSLASPNQRLTTRLRHGAPRLPKPARRGAGRRARVGARVYLAGRPLRACPDPRGEPRHGAMAPP